MMGDSSLVSLQPGRRKPAVATGLPAAGVVPEAPAAKGDSACGCATPCASTAPALPEAPGTYSLPIEGMDCPTCARTLEKAVGAVSGVQRVQVDFALATLSLSLSTSSGAHEEGLERVRTAVAAAGYRVGALPDARTAQAGGSQTWAFQVAELDCDEEKRLIERVLGRMPQVGSVNVSLLSRTVSVTLEASADRNRIIDALAGVGLTARASKMVEAPPEPRWSAYVTAGLGAVGLAIGELLEHFGPRSAAILAFAVVVVGLGHPLLKAGWRSARARSLDMNVLMSLAVLGAAGLGDWAEAATVVWLFAIAQRLEAASLERARRSISSLLEAAPSEAEVMTPEGSVMRPVESVRPGTLIRVRPGGRIPLDGLVEEGSSSVNQAVITGESMPVEVEKGSRVFAGSLTREGALVIRTVHEAGQSTLARIQEAVRQTQAARAPVARMVDRFAEVYTPIVIAIAAAVAVLPPLLGGQSWSEWLSRALVLLVIACPCALVISTPVSIVSGLAAAARMGVLIKGGVHLEQLGRIQAVALDKTGTLTRGLPRVTSVVGVGVESDEVLRLASAVEAQSEHPLAQAIVAEAAARGVGGAVAQNVRAEVGLGAVGQVEGLEVRVGRAAWAQAESAQGQSTPKSELIPEGETPVAVSRAGVLLGYLGLSDPLRPESVQVIERLKAQGMGLELLSGDVPAVVKAIAARAGGMDARGGLLPEEKVQALAQLRHRFGAVAMVGDGVNDAPALAAADVGIAIGAAGNDTALEVADVALLSEGLDRLPDALALGRRTRAIIRQNVTAAIGVKLPFLALAIPGLATLWMAILADTGMSLAVIFNGLRLLQTPRPARPERSVQGAPVSAH